MPKNLYEKYEEIIDSIVDLKGFTKYKGKVANELLRLEIKEFLDKEGYPLEVSEINSYIQNSKYEYDLLLVKKGATSSPNFAYNPSDVVCVIECKLNGLYDIQKNTDSIAEAFNTVGAINHKIVFGYITFSEVVPKNYFNKDGKPTIKYWDATQTNLAAKIHGENDYFAVTLRTGKTVVKRTTTNDFENFLKKLLYKSI
ncbi:hypothetical protein [Streptococcus anginosus]|uniref:hypothetical protein n=1 Tax=Streptococcus anginosus TaxID=1328 RepID=UPI0022E22546|nr:hypothetical protein [Streptococcus anginosus]